MYLFSPKNVLEGAKIMYVNNVLENQIWAVPLLPVISPPAWLQYGGRCSLVVTSPGAAAGAGAASSILSWAVCEIKSCPTRKPRHETPPEHNQEPGACCATWKYFPRSTARAAGHWDTGDYADYEPYLGSTIFIRQSLFSCGRLSTWGGDCIL